MDDIRFDVFGRRVAVRRDGRRWRAFELGPEGKRRPADSVVPSDMLEDELGQYLADLFHEHATPARTSVRRLP